MIQEILADYDTATLKRWLAREEQKRPKDEQYILILRNEIARRGEK